MIGRRLRRLSRIGQTRPRAVCPPSVAAEQDHPRLRVACVHPGFWFWEITEPCGDVLDSGHGLSHPEALAVGLAALETASLTEPR